ncbi:MAG: hypothetical protein ACTHNW_21755 [Mucilaginibacter sp.]
MRLLYLTISALFLMLVLGGMWFIFKNPYPARFAANQKKTVYIRYENGKYTLYRFGKPFFIKGGAGTTHLPELSAIGGNTIRTWDTVGIDGILADAQRNHIAVIVGLPMPYNENMDAFYNNDAKVKAQFVRYQLLVRKYRNNKAILCWCLGNELAYPVRPQYYKFYTIFNRLVDMIHREDPNHPVTTTLINFEKKYLVNLKLWTHIDFISFNIFGYIRQLKGELNDFRCLWNGPFLITEWGIDGPWPEHEHTIWNAYIEPTSDKKAEQYLELYQRYMPLNNPGFLGSLVFYWGHKQETTPTWFSLFDKEGNKSEVVNVMQYVWTGRLSQQQAPSIKYMLVDGKGARDNLLYNPGTVIKAKVFFNNRQERTNLHFEWFVQREDWFKLQHFYNQKELPPLDSLAISATGDNFVFHAPEKEGPYRVFTRIYNDKGYFATCNTPFYVVGAK